MPAKPRLSAVTSTNPSCQPHSMFSICRRLKTRNPMGSISQSRLLALQSRKNTPMQDHQKQCQRDLGGVHLRDSCSIG